MCGVVDVDDDFIEAGQRVQCGDPPAARRSRLGKRKDVVLALAAAERARAQADAHGVGRMPVASSRFNTPIELAITGDCSRCGGGWCGHCGIGVRRDGRNRWCR
ncbi:hypothetical protein GCM10022255_101660 [Dactylosporangium darangshiense]|uniref:Uncharacterized protein n=1 Tax=Dactylosporangium darangshiense TaxID=579108 RepID=A0ABP8DSU1_9ACTN